MNVLHLLYGLPGEKGRLGHVLKQQQVDPVQTAFHDLQFPSMPWPERKSDLRLFMEEGGRQENEITGYEYIIANE